MEIDFEPRFKTEYNTLLKKRTKVNNVHIVEEHRKSYIEYTPEIKGNNYKRELTLIESN